MALKQTKAPAPAAAKPAAAAPAKTTKNPKAGSDAMAAAREARERVSRNDKFVYHGEVPEGTKKLAPQAQVIVNLVQAAGKKGLSREELVKEMEGNVTTKQPLGRILSYYQKHLVDTGHVTIVEAAPEKTTEAESDE